MYILRKDLMNPPQKVNIYKSFRKVLFLIAKNQLQKNKIFYQWLLDNNNGVLI